MLQETDKYKFLTEAPVNGVILKMAIPTIMSMLVTSLYNMVDTYFVGRLDTQSTAAVGIVFSFMFFIQSFGFFFGHGSGNYISRELGAKHHAKAEKMASIGFFSSFLFGCIILLYGEILLKPLSLLLGSTPTILPYTERYLWIILLGTPFLTSSLTLNCQMRLQGYANKSMQGMVMGALLNCILDPLFIFTFNMGLSGAAIATVVGQIVSFGILLAMTRQDGIIGIRWSNFKPTWIAMKEIFYGGSPSLSRQGLGCFATVALNYTAGIYGDAAIAAMSIVNRITMFVMSMVVGLGQGFQPVCGFCYGARLFDRLKQAYWFVVKVGTIFLIVMGLIGIYYSHEIVSLFRDDAAVVAIGAPALVWQLVAYPFNALSMASNMMTQTCRKPWRANILAAARKGLFFVPLILILPYFFGLKGVEMCQAWSDILAFILTVPVMIYTFKQLDSEFKEENGDIHYSNEVLE